jgi:hypothetical protein
LRPTGPPDGTGIVNPEIPIRITRLVLRTVIEAGGSAAIGPYSKSGRVASVTFPAADRAASSPTSGVCTTVGDRSPPMAALRASRMSAA